MKIVAAAISLLIGAAFFAVAFVLPYYPSLFGLGDSLQSIVSGDQSRARAAVSKLLINPDSAKFHALREVKLQIAKYVCGEVDGKDSAGSYPGPRAFVYDVISDFAVIDDAGLISRPHNRFRPCPAPEQPKIAPLVVDLGKVNTVANALPKTEIQGLSSSGAGSGGPGGGADMQQTLARFGSTGASQSSGQSSSSEGSPTALALADEKDWRGDRPPGAWPKFAADDPLSKPGPKLSNGEAIELSAEIEARWKRFETGKTTAHPSVNEINEARRALLAINEQSAEFPQAWASFVRLQKIHGAAARLAKQG
jgi:hypothetical protein